ncbi:MAG: tetratricopeptide repeat protein, partial [Bacteroidota bacterium]
MKTKIIISVGWSKMKTTLCYFLLFVLFVSVTPCVYAQDTFTKFSERLEALNRKVQDVKSDSTQHKKKHVGRIKKQLTIDYTHLTNDSSGVTLDTILKKRMSKRIRNIDSLNAVNGYSDANVNDSIPKKRKKKKSEEYYSKNDSLRTDSLMRIGFIEDDSAMSKLDTTPTPLQIVYMDSAYGFLMDNKFEDAILYYDLVTTLFRGTEVYKFAFYWRAKAEIGINDFTNAFNDMNSFISIDNCNSSFCSDAYYSRAIIRFKLSDYENAATDFTKVLADTTYSNLKYCYFYRAFCLGESEKYIQAVQDYTRFLVMDNYKSVSSAEALYYRGFYKVKLDDNRGAISDYDQAIAMYSGAYESSKGKNQIYFQKLIDTYITRGLAKAE